MSFVLFVLTIFLVLGSLVALQMRDLLSAVIAIGVVGLGLSILFLMLGAPDIAITQVVVEVIVVTVLIRAAGKTGRTEPRGPRRDLAALAVGGVALVACLVFLLVGFAALPAFGSAPPPLAIWYLTHAPTMTGATNVVTAILLDYRAFDTLGEATVILCAIVGVLAILRRPAKSERKGARPPEPEIDPEGSPETERKADQLEEALHG
jgi:multisubunit Na+/H+ antiporter MnhB subunit